MQIFHYDQSTGEYLGSALADESPLEDGVFHVPAFATETAPPAPEAGKARVFAGDEWTLVDDRRGETWWRGHNDPVTVDFLGDPARQGLVATEPAPPPPTVSDVIIERARRLADGFDYDFGDARGVHHIGTTEADQVGWDEVTAIALARQATGSTTPITVVTDTGAANVTPLEWLAILEAAAAFRQPIWAASFSLQAIDPIPADYADNSRWPS